MVHGVPVYNVARREQKPPPPAELQAELKAKWPAAATDAQLIGQIMEMGFTRRTVELALKQLSLQAEIMPTPEQIVQWILEHPDVCANTIEEDSLALPPSTSSSHDPEADSDNECPSSKSNSNSTTSSSSSSSSSDTVEGQPPGQAAAAAGAPPPVKFESRKDFQTADLYALYVRGLVRPGMTVRCCRDFEEIKQGDMGTVLIVDTEGLHDLNVQVDWRNHGSTYWVCFVHIELVEAAQSQHQPRPPPIVVGARVRLNTSSSSLRLAMLGQLRLGRMQGQAAVGVVTSVRGKQLTVDFPDMPAWQGHINEVELVSPHPGPNASASAVMPPPWRRGWPATRRRPATSSRTGRGASAR